MNWEGTTLEDLAWWVGPQKRGRGRPCHPEARLRDLDIVERFKGGQTLASIGSVYNITRERVRQVIKKVGLTKLDGGKAISTFLLTHDKIAKINEQREKSEAFKRKTWGISLDEWKRIRSEFGYKPFQAYMYQRRTARTRGIGWEFDFRAWFDFWLESGHWHERGRGKGYCMARFGDSGPYSKENVYICTVGENFSDSYITKPARSRNRPPRSPNCPNGHPRTSENTYTRNNGGKSCRLCRILAVRRYQQKFRK